MMTYLNITCTLLNIFTTIHGYLGFQRRSEVSGFLGIAMDCISNPEAFGCKYAGFAWCFIIASSIWYYLMSLYIYNYNIYIHIIITYIYICWQWPGTERFHGQHQGHLDCKNSYKDPVVNHIGKASDLIHAVQPRVSNPGRQYGILPQNNEIAWITSIHIHTNNHKHMVYVHIYVRILNINMYIQIHTHIYIYP